MSSEGSGAWVVPLPTRSSTIRLAKRLAPLLAAGDLVVLDGPLGVGKTFFTRAVCRVLGLPESEPVTSPTFTLIQEIATRPPVAHADVYRLTSGEEVRDLGLDSLREEGRLLLVEWGAPYVDLLGGDALVMEWAMPPRRVAIRASGTRSAAIVERLRAR